MDPQTARANEFHVMHKDEMRHTQAFADAEEWPHDRHFSSEIPKFRKLVESLGLTGLANNTKWNELLTYMRSKKGGVWRPSFRCNCLGTDYISEWDCEWHYHVPLPFIQVRWLELSFREEILKGLLEPVIIDHSEELESLLNSIGFEYEKGAETIRIFGYAPKDRTGFKVPKNA